MPPLVPKPSTRKPAAPRPPSTTAEPLRPSRATTAEPLRPSRPTTAGPLRPSRPKKPKARASKPSPRRAARDIPAESALLWGLLLDAQRFPLLLFRGLLQRDRAALHEAFARPAARLSAFLTAARVTAALIGLNLLAYAYEVQQSHLLTSTAFLRRFALSADGLRRGELAPLLLHLFAHQGPAHLCGNLLALFVFGRIVERHLGALWTAGTYLAAATVSTGLSLCAQVVLHRSVPTLGASGAITGLVALAMLLEPLALTFEALLPMPVVLLGWVALLADLSGVAAGGRRDGIDHFAHLGGYLSGLLAYPFLGALGEAVQRRARAGLLLNLLTAGSTILLLFLWPPAPQSAPSAPPARKPPHLSAPATAKR